NLHALFLSHPRSPSKRDSIENQTKRLIGELLLGCVAWKSESAVLEALGKETEARAIPVNQLHVVATTVEKHVETSRKRVLSERVPHQDDQSVERLAHVDGRTVREDPARHHFRKHDQPRKRRTTPLGSSTSSDH